MRTESRPSAWMTFSVIFMIPSDHRPILITESTNALEKFLGFFKSLPSTSLKLWRILKFLSCCSWCLFLLQRISASIQHTSSPLCTSVNFFVCGIWGCSCSERPKKVLMPFLCTCWCRCCWWWYCWWYYCHCCCSCRCYCCYYWW